MMFSAKTQSGKWLFSVSSLEGALNLIKERANIIRHRKIQVRDETGKIVATAYIIGGKVITVKVDVEKQ